MEGHSYPDTMTGPPSGPCKSYLHIIPPKDSNILDIILIGVAKSQTKYSKLKNSQCEAREYKRPAAEGEVVVQSNGPQFFPMKLKG